MGCSGIYGQPVWPAPARLDRLWSGGWRQQRRPQGVAVRAGRQPLCRQPDLANRWAHPGWAGPEPRAGPPGPLPLSLARGLQLAPHPGSPAPHRRPQPDRADELFELVVSAAGGAAPGPPAPRAGCGPRRGASPQPALQRLLGGG